MQSLNITDVWDAVGPSIKEVRAIQALSVGEATAEQQKTAMKWILHRACGISLDPFDPHNPRVEANRIGRRTAGNLIAKVLTMQVEQARKNGEVDG